MRLLFEGRMNSTTAELVFIGCELMTRISFAHRRNNVDDYNLGIIARCCLLGDEGAVAVRTICRNLKQAVLKSETYAFYHDGLLNVLLSIQALATLDGLCGGTKSDLDSGMQILRQAGQVRGHPLDAIPDADLLSWCDQESDERYPAVAGSVTPFQPSDDSTPFTWTPIARKLLDLAPDRIAVAKQLIAGSRPMFWTGSGAALLEELGAYPDPGLREHIASERVRLLAAADEDRRVQVLFDQQVNTWGSDERFE